MPIIQPQNPKAQRKLQRQTARPTRGRHTGSISRAAPVMQEAIRRDRIKRRNRRVAMVAGALATIIVTFAIAINVFDNANTAHLPTLQAKAAVAAIKAPVSNKPVAPLVEMETPYVAEDPRLSLDMATTPQEFVDRAKVNGVRLNGKRSRAVINGHIYYVGDVVAPEMGLQFIGHDPDGEYLLFRDQRKRTLFIRIHERGEAS